ncbi:hypothetical protein Q2356_25240, partial [Escherichia coli]|nr:hypothetical protein [Escherichia coli]
MLGIVFQQIAQVNVAFTKQAEMEFTNAGNATAASRFEAASFARDHHADMHRAILQQKFGLGAGRVPSHMVDSSAALVRVAQQRST